MSNNWRTMDAGPELDKFIAVLLGWYIREVEPEVHPALRYQIIDPDGHQRGKTEPSEDKAWAWLNKLGFSFTTDVNAAALLMADIEDEEVGLFYLEYRPTAGRPATETNWRAVCLSMAHKADEHSPALAICRAWLAWKEAQD